MNPAPNHRPPETEERKQWRSSSHLQIIARDGWACKACGRYHGEKGMTLDHNIPLVRGGGDEVENLSRMCFVCNRAKGALTFWEWDTLGRPDTSHWNNAPVRFWAAIPTQGVGALLAGFQTKGGDWNIREMLAVSLVQGGTYNTCFLTRQGKCIPAWLHLRHLSFRQRAHASPYLLTDDKQGTTPPTPEQLFELANKAREREAAYTAKRGLIARSREVERCLGQPPHKVFPLPNNGLPFIWWPGQEVPR